MKVNAPERENMAGDPIANVTVPETLWTIAVVENVTLTTAFPGVLIASSTVFPVLFNCTATDPERTMSEGNPKTEICPDAVNA